MRQCRVFAYRSTKIILSILDIVNSLWIFCYNNYWLTKRKLPHCNQQSPVRSFPYDSRVWRRWIIPAHSFSSLGSSTIMTMLRSSTHRQRTVYTTALWLLLLVVAIMALCVVGLSTASNSGGNWQTLVSSFISWDCEFTAKTWNDVSRLWSHCSAGSYQSVAGQSSTRHREARWLRCSSQHFDRTDCVCSGSTSHNPEHQITSALFDSVPAERPVFQFQLQGCWLRLHMWAFRRLSV